MSEEQLKMSTRDALDYVADLYQIPSLYKMAQSLSDDTLTVQPIQISNYLNGSVMSEKVATRFEAIYGIFITDAIRSGIFRQRPIQSKPSGE